MRTHGSTKRWSQAHESPRIEDAYTRLATELNLFLAQLRPVWSRRRMIDHHRALVLDLETTGDVSALRRHLDDGLEAVLERHLALGSPARPAVEVCRARHRDRFVPPRRIVKTSAKVVPRRLRAPPSSVAKTIEAPSGENDPART